MTLCDQQHAYRPNKSCQTALYEFTSYVYDKLDKQNGKVGALFIDLKDAFICISHSQLVRKLLTKYKVNPYLVRLIFESLAGRSYKFVNGTKYYKIHAGAGQGSILGSLIFCLFLDDIAEVINLPFLFYSDDILVHTNGSDINQIISDLESCFDKMCTWFDNNNMYVNFDKTKYMILCKNRDPTLEKVKQFRVKEHDIERVFSFKYLGIIIDPALNFNLHLDLVLSKISSRVKFILGVKRYLNVQAMKAMVNAHLHSVTDYCVDIWAVQGTNKLDLIQSKIDKFIYCYPSLAKRRPSCNLSFTKIRDSDDMMKLRNECNFLTLSERLEYVTLKNAFKRYLLCKLSFTPRSASLDFTMPKLPPIVHKTESLKRSILFRTYKLWNALPTDWVLKELTYPSFCHKVKALIISRRAS